MTHPIRLTPATQRSRIGYCQKRASARFRLRVPTHRQRHRRFCTSGSVNYAWITAHASDGSIHRYYDPATGQFLSVDPALDLTGQPYAYSQDDPVNNTDPSGLITCPSWVPGCGVVTKIQNTISGGVNQVVNGTYGLCISGVIGWGLGGTGQVCLVESGLGRHLGVTESLGGGGQSPVAGVSLGIESSNATSPSQLKQWFGNANGSVVFGPDIGATAGGSTFFGQDACNKTIVGDEFNVGLAS